MNDDFFEYLMATNQLPGYEDDNTEEDLEDYDESEELDEELED